MNNSALTTLVDKLKMQNESKHDMIVPASKLDFHDGKLFVQSDVSLEGFNPTDICHRQIAEKLGIPAHYYRRMQDEYPALMEQNVNGWLQREKSKYLIRTFTNPENFGTARAMLSDRFNLIDNYDVLFAALEAIKGMGVNVDIKKAEVTDKRMYLHVVCPDIEQDAEEFLKGYLVNNDAAGNGIISGMVITNSEVGLGSFEIRPRAVICKCNNGLIVKDETFKKIHLGGKMDEGTIIWSEKTKKKNYELIISQTQDAVKTFLSKECLGRMITKIADLHNIVLNHPIDAVQNICKELAITEDHRRDILKHFMNDGDHMASGIYQAITKQAQAMNPDAQHDLEINAFEVISHIKRHDKPFSKN